MATRQVIFRNHSSTIYRSEEVGQAVWQQSILDKQQRFWRKYFSSCEGGRSSHTGCVMRRVIATVATAETAEGDRQLAGRATQTPCNTAQTLCKSLGFQALPENLWWHQRLILQVYASTQKQQELNFLPVCTPMSDENTWQGAFSFWIPSYRRYHLWMKFGTASSHCNTS